MRRPFIFTSLGVVRGESKRGNRKCGPENTLFRFINLIWVHHVVASLVPSSQRELTVWREERLTIYLLQNKLLELMFAVFGFS